MTYGKIENEKLIYAPHRIVLGDMQIFNPTPDHLTQAGYKLVTETPIPEDPAPEGQHYEALYTDSGDTITQSWMLVENEEVEPAGKTLEERVTDLETGQAEMDRIFEEVVNSESGIL